MFVRAAQTEKKDREEDGCFAVNREEILKKRKFSLSLGSGDLPRANSQGLPFPLKLNPACVP